MGEKERQHTKRKVKEIRGRKEREEGGREGGREEGDRREWRRYLVSEAGAE